MSKLVQTLRKRALRHPGTSEGIACEGTPVEKRTVKVGSKAFLFLGVADAMFKLTDSAAKEATKLGLQVGKHGWVKVPFEGAPPLARLEKWVDESYRAVAGAKKTGSR
jgi:predicted DNA-binding protein (MmcQ/YjbR family)